MRSFAIAVTAALLVAALLSAVPRQAEAKKCGGPFLHAEHAEDGYTRYLEAEWGDTVRLHGSCWLGWVAGELWLAEEVDVFARFLPERPGGEVRDLPLEPSLVITRMEDGGFDEPFRLEDVYDRPEEPHPGWIEFIARADGEEVRASTEVRVSILVTADGRRPPGSPYVAGRVHNMPASSSRIYVIWSPVDDPSAYAFAAVPEGGEYRTDYLSEGEWFIGIYDISEEVHASDPDLQPVTGYSSELDRDATLTGRTMMVSADRPIGGIDFTLTDGPAPSSGAIRVDTRPDEPQASRAAPVQAQDDAPATQLDNSDGGSAGWLGPALLATGGGLIFAMAAATRWWRLRRWS